MADQKPIKLDAGRQKEWVAGDVLSISSGGTGAEDAAGARTNLGLGTAATKNEGAGSNLDADTLDGLHEYAFARLSSINTIRIIDQGSLPEGQAMATTLSHLGAFEARASNAGGTPGAAFIAFHRLGAHAAYLGLDIDNKLKIGGWSLGANAYEIFHEGTTIPQEAWITPTLLNGWVNFGGGWQTAGYFKDKQGMVHVRAMLKDGTTGNNVTGLALPVGYRPGTNEGILHMANNVGAMVRLDINTNGNVGFYATSATWLSFYVVFRAGA